MSREKVIIGDHVKSLLIASDCVKGLEPDLMTDLRSLQFSFGKYNNGCGLTLLNLLWAVDEYNNGKKYIDTFTVEVWVGTGYGALKEQYHTSEELLDLIDIEDLEAAILKEAESAFHWLFQEMRRVDDIIQEIKYKGR